MREYSQTREHTPRDTSSQSKMLGSMSFSNYSAAPQIPPFSNISENTKMVTMFSDAEMRHYAFQARTKAEKSWNYSKESAIIEFWEILKINLDREANPDKRDYFLFNQIEHFLRKLLPLPDESLAESPELINLWLVYLQHASEDTKLHLLYFLLDAQIGTKEPILYYHIIRLHLEQEEFVLADEWIREVKKLFPDEQRSEKWNEAVQVLTRTVDTQLKDLVGSSALFCDGNWTQDKTGIPRDLFEYLFARPIDRKRSELLKYPLEAPKDSKPWWADSKPNDGQVNKWADGSKENNPLLQKAVSQPLSLKSSLQPQSSLSPLSKMMKQQTEVKKVRPPSPRQYKRLSDTCEIDLSGATRTFVDRECRSNVFAEWTLRTRELEYRKALAGIIDMDKIRESQVIPQPGQFDFFKEREFREEKHRMKANPVAHSISRIFSQAKSNLSQGMASVCSTPNRIVPESTSMSQLGSANMSFGGPMSEPRDYSAHKMAMGTNRKPIPVLSSPRPAQPTPLTNRAVNTPNSVRVPVMTPHRSDWRP